MGEYSMGIIVQCSNTMKQCMNEIHFELQYEMEVNLKQCGLLNPHIDSVYIKFPYQYIPKYLNNGSNIIYGKNRRIFCMECTRNGLRRCYICNDGREPMIKNSNKRSICHNHRVIKCTICNYECDESSIEKCIYCNNKHCLNYLLQCDMCKQMKCDNLIQTQCKKCGVYVCNECCPYWICQKCVNNEEMECQSCHQNELKQKMKQCHICFKSFCSLCIANNGCGQTCNICQYKMNNYMDCFCEQSFLDKFEKYYKNQRLLKRE